MNKALFTTLTAEILQADATLSITLIALEKLLEKEFHCPCDSSIFFCDTLFACSSLIIILTAALIQINRLKEARRTDGQIRWFRIGKLSNSFSICL